MKHLKSKITYIFFFYLLISVYSCNEDEEAIQEASEKLVNFITEEKGTPSSFNKTVISYFKEITLGSEFDKSAPITKKWVSNIDIFIIGDENPELIAELNDVINELNLLISASKIKISIVNTRPSANVIVYFESSFNYGNRFPERRKFLDANAGLFFFKNNSENEITSAEIFVDTQKGTVINQRSLIREEFTQALGFGNDSPRYQDSIFFEDPINDRANRTNRNIEYSRLDKTIIKLLYDPRVNTGLDAKEVSQVLEVILYDTN